MSRFFRSSADSDSDSESSDEGEGETSVDQITNNASTTTSTESSLALDLAREHSSLQGMSAAGLEAANASHHRDVLLHALLEERCMNEAIKDAATSNRKRDDARIKAAAQAKYQRLCAQLAPYGLVSGGLDGEAHSNVRQRYREGLDLLSTTLLSSQPGFISRGGPLGLQRLLSAPVESSDLTWDLQRLQLTPSKHSIPRSLTSAMPMQPMLDSGRYRNEFEEVGVLGKGGYGVVFQAKHKLDGMAYAVKKVPLSTSRRARLETRGQSELDEILRELRTLARLDHPNIVRYHSGWVEWTSFTSSSTGSGTPTQQNGRLLLGNGGTPIGAEQTPSFSFRSLSRFSGQRDDDATNIVFESSASRDSGHSKESHHSSRSDRSAEGASLFRPPTHSTNATVSDEDVESISRESEPSASVPFQSNTDGVEALRSDEPCPAVHIQMGLYPMTLAEYISPPLQPSTASNGVLPLSHCFHLQPSVNIMKAILDGVEYLHSEGIIHRDLKPGNIFLAPKNTLLGSSDLCICTTCQEQGSAQPMSLNVRIGDFGLVAVVNDDAGEDAGIASNSRAVGTEIYRPTYTECEASAALDVFALGIVFFELLWKFGTRMERMDTVQRLKQGIFPAGFVEHTRDWNGNIRACLSEMLGLTEQAPVDIRLVRHKIDQLYTT